MTAQKMIDSAQVPVGSNRTLIGLSLGTLGSIIAFAITGTMVAVSWSQRLTNAQRETSDRLTRLELSIGKVSDEVKGLSERMDRRFSEYVQKNDLEMYFRAFQSRGFGGATMPPQQETRAE